MAIKVSICIPAYKQTDLLRKALRSVDSQEFRDFEIILSDDSPGNEVRELLDEFSFGPRLLYFHNVPSLGTPANWNFAISKASGEYIKMLHHDDFFTSPGSLAEYVRLLDEHPQADLAFSATQVWRMSTDEKWKHCLTAKKEERLRNDPSFLFFGNWIGAPSAVICRRSIKEHYDENLKWLVDTDFYMRILQRNPVFAWTGQELVCTTDGAPGQVTGQVLDDVQLQIREHIYVYDRLRAMPHDEKKFSLYFQVLFKKLGVHDMSALAALTDIPNDLRAFFTKVMYEKDKNVFLRNMAEWFYSSRFNNKIFKMERF